MWRGLDGLTCHVDNICNERLSLVWQFATMILNGI